MSLPLLGGGSGSGGGAVTNASAFLARTSGLDTTHINAYTDLINGLDTDGLFSKFDLLHVYATQDSTTAKLNLVSSSYPATTVSGPPTFTTDRGFTSASGGYFNTGFNATTASSPKYTLNSAHLSVWSLTSSQFSADVLGIANSAIINPRFTDNNGYHNVNGAGGSAVASTDGSGHFTANRSASNALQAYKNGSSILSNSAASTSLSNNVIFTLAGNNGAGSPTFPVNACQTAAVSIGSSLNSTDATNFYNRLRTYMTAVGVP
jgi:hypothetical protein